MPVAFNPIRSRTRSAAVFVLSLAVFVPALVLPRSGDDLTVRKLVLFGSLAVLLMSGVWLIVRWDEARRLLRLRSGKGVIARWTIDAAHWERFRRQSLEWDRRKDVRPNDADLSQTPRSGGIEIVVTNDAVLIGEDFSPLERDVRITVRADWMEFYQIIPKPRGSPFHMVLRIPLQPGREALASNVQQAYQRANHAKGTGVSLTMLALLIFIGLPAVTALAWLIARVTGWVQ